MVLARDEWKALPSARDLFQGACPDGVSSPRNVLMFSRERAAALRLGAQDSFQHRSFVVIFNIAASGSVAVDCSWIRLKPGHALLVFPYQVHTYGHIEQKNIRWIFLTFESDVPESWEVLRQRPVKGSDRLLHLLSSAMDTWRRQREHSLELPYWAGLILLEMLGLVQSSEPPHIASGSHLLPKIHALVHRPEGQVWRIKTLAQELRISEPHLRASFRTEAGVSLGTYLRRVRLTRAASLLASTDCYVGEVALLCGYDSLYSFSRSFRTIMGCSPRSYRQQLKGNHY